MHKVVTLRLDSEIYNLFSHLAKDDNRTLSNYIETAARKYVEQNVEYVDEFEMAEIKNNKKLNESLQRALKQVKNKQGRFIA